MRGFRQVLCICATLAGPIVEPGNTAAAELINGTPSDEPLFQTLSQAQWKRMLPDLGDASPEIAILHVDPNTHATQLLIRTP